MSAVPARPLLRQLNQANIPAELRAVTGWVGWRLVFEARRWTKKPVDIKTGDLAETDNPKTWSDFDRALQNYERCGCDGIGLCRTADFIFIDCDGIFDCDGNLLQFPWAGKILSAIAGRAYVEKSVTGTGLHGIARGTLPPGRRQFDDPDRTHTGYAFYDKNRFFTLRICQEITVSTYGQEAVVPVAMKLVSPGLEFGHLLVGNLQPGRISVGVELAFHLDYAHNERSARWFARLMAPVVK